MTEPSWTFSAEAVSPNRLRYLTQPITFDEIIRRIFNEMQITRYIIDPAKHNKNLVALGCRRPVFKIKVSSQTYDIFFNSPWGYRAQFYQDADDGRAKNKLLIEAILEKLLTYAEKSSTLDDLGKQLSPKQLLKSLLHHSAKIWIDEYCFDCRFQLLEEILNPRWLEIARTVHQEMERSRKEETNAYEKRAIWGVRAPVGATLEVKGAWLDLGDNETESDDKKRRHLDIHDFGFS